MTMHNYYPIIIMVYFNYRNGATNIVALFSSSDQSYTVNDNEYC